MPRKCIHLRRLNPWIILALASERLKLVCDFVRSHLQPPYKIAAHLRIPYPSLSVPIPSPTAPYLLQVSLHLHELRCETRKTKRCVDQQDILSEVRFRQPVKLRLRVTLHEGVTLHFTGNSRIQA